jgi:DNA-binding NarL/FixJ family response regulator
VHRVPVCRVLIVDDNSVLRRAMRSCLERYPDLQVCGEAENGQIAIEQFWQLKPDFVILDYSMPVMNGVEAARCISSIAPNVPLMMFTLFKSEQLVQEAQQAGVDRVLSKDETGDLVTMIKRLIQSRSPLN